MAAKKTNKLNYVFFIECEDADTSAAVRDQIIERSGGARLMDYGGPSSRRRMYEIEVTGWNSQERLEKIRNVKKQLRRLSRGKIRFEVQWCAPYPGVA